MYVCKVYMFQSELNWLHPFTKKTRKNYLSQNISFDLSMIQMRVMSVSCTQVVTFLAIQNLQIARMRKKDIKNI